MIEENYIEPIAILDSIISTTSPLQTEEEETLEEKN
jgi:hypothetical protein